MARINRTELLQKLEAVSAGVSKRELIEQSSCFVFKEGVACSFNDEIACTVPLELGLTGAVAAAPLLALLGKLAEDEVDLEQVENELRVKGKGRAAGLAMEADVLLPIDSVETPGKWIPVTPEFIEGIGFVRDCATGDESKFVLTCVHIHPEYVEACDDFQLARFPVASGLKKPTLVRAASIKHILGLDMTEMSGSANWLHFRNPAGLTLSCRRFAENYPDLTAQLTPQAGAQPVSLPGGLAEAVDKAQIFSAENAENNTVMVELKPGKLRIRGQGITGWYQEVKNIGYEGEPLSFMIAPKLLTEIAKKHNACELSAGRLRVDGGKFVFVTCLGKV